MISFILERFCFVLLAKGNIQILTLFLYTSYFLSSTILLFDKQIHFPLYLLMMLLHKIDHPSWFTYVISTSIVIKNVIAVFFDCKILPLATRYICALKNDLSIKEKNSHLWFESRTLVTPSLTIPNMYSVVEIKILINGNDYSDANDSHYQNWFWKAL